MKSHSKLGRDPKDDAETNTEEQSDHGGIIIGAEIAGDEYPCPDSDGDDDCGYYGTDYAGDDNIVSPARNIFGNSGRHFTDGLK